MATLHRLPPNGIRPMPMHAPSPRHRREPVEMPIRHCDTKAPAKMAAAHQDKAKGVNNSEYCSACHRSAPLVAKTKIGTPMSHEALPNTTAPRAARSKYARAA